MSTTSIHLPIYYCVLWMPTTHHKQLAPLNTITFGQFQEQKENGKPIDDVLVLLDNGDITLYNANISDIDNNPLFLDITLKRNTDDLHPQRRSVDIKCKRQKDSDYVWELFLKSEDTSRNGLAKYSYIYDRKQKNPLLNSDGNLTHAVYHAIKRFYHSHHFHESCKDSIVNPYCSKSMDVNIKAVDNEAILHYLSLFEEMFSRFLGDFRTQSEIIEKFYSGGAGGEGKDRAFKASNFLLSECTNALGISLFAKSLLLSKYNHSFKVTKRGEENGDPNQAEDCHKACDDRTFCQRAINLYSSIEYIRLIKIRSRNFLNIAVALLNAERQNSLKESLDRLESLQGKMDSNFIELTKLQSDINGQVTETTVLQKTMNTAIEEVRKIQQTAETTSKRWNKISLVLGGTSLVLGGISFHLALKSPSSNDIENIVQKKLEIQQVHMDSLLSERSKVVIDPFRSAPLEIQ